MYFKPKSELKNYTRRLNIRKLKNILKPLKNKGGSEKAFVIITKKVVMILICDVYSN